jgi:hypothetical protein
LLLFLLACLEPYTDAEKPASGSIP